MPPIFCHVALAFRITRSAPAVGAKRNAMLTYDPHFACDSVDGALYVTDTHTHAPFRLKLLANLALVVCGMTSSYFKSHKMAAANKRNRLCDTAIVHLVL